MPVSATIPVTEDYREAIIPLAEASHFTGLIYVNGYLFACSETGVGKLLKIKADDFSIRTSLTFPNDNKHIGPVDLCYAASTDRIYVLFRNGDSGQLTISKTDPDTMTFESDFKNVDLTGDFTVGPGSITTDNASLYVASFHDDPSQVTKYRLSDGLFQANGQVTGFTQAHCIRYSSNKLYATGLRPPVDCWAARLSAGPIALEASTTFAAPEGEFAVDDFGVSSDSIWVGNRDAAGVVRKISKTDFTSITQLATTQLSKCTCVEAGGNDIWALYENGRGVRFNPGTNEQAIYTVNPGEGYQLEIVGDGTYLYTIFATATTTKITRYRIPSDVAPEWAKSFGSTGFDGGMAVTTDSGGNIFVAGNFSGTVDFGNGTPPITSAGDRDVFVVKLSSSGDTVWAKGFGGVSLDVAASIALDADGNIYVGAKMDSTGKSLLKLSPTGTLLWTKGPPCGFASIAVDSDGNVVATGNFVADFTNQMDFGEGHFLYSILTSVDAFLAKYSPAGTCLWAKSFNNGGDKEYGLALAVDQSDDTILLAGWAYANIDLGGGMIQGDTWGAFGFLGKFDSDGNHLLSRSIGLKIAGDPSLAWTRVFSMGLDGDGNILIGGSFGYQTRLGGPLRVTGAIDRSAFIVKYRGTDLSYIWDRPILGDKSCYVSGVAVDEQDTVFATGYFYGTFHFDGGTAPEFTLSNPSNVQIWDIFAAKYGSDGTPVWVRKYGGTQNDQGFAIVMSPSTVPAAPVITGQFQGTVTFGDTSLTSAGTLDCFVTKLAPQP